MTAKPTAVQLFVTCLVEAVRPEVGLAVVEVLERLGVQVELPTGQTCCGQPAFNAGLWDEARAMAAHTLDVLSRSPAPIVVPSGSCGDMLIHRYAELMAGDPHYGPLAKAVAARTYEFTQFVVEVLGVTDVGAHYPGTLTYHAACHQLRELGIVQPPRQLLANIQGAQVVELPGATECCGFGGLFSVKMSDISGAMLKRKLANIAASGAQTVVACDVSCLMHIAGGLRRRGQPVEARHLAELLAARPSP